MATKKKTRNDYAKLKDETMPKNRQEITTQG